MNSRSSGAAPAPTRGSGARPLRLVAVGSAIALQAVVLVPFTVGSGLLAPLWAVVVLYLLWGASAVALWFTARRRPLAAPLVPLVNAALLFGLVSFGEAVLGWTA
jgi:hypothetical protein